MLGSAPVREPWRVPATGEAASNSSRVTSGSSVGIGDQVHSVGGLTLPARRPRRGLRRRFHTMCPVYFGLHSKSRTAEPVHLPTAREGSAGSGGGLAAGSSLSGRRSCRRTLGLSAESEPFDLVECVVRGAH